MLFQLSELYWEKSKYLYAKEMLQVHRGAEEGRRGAQPGEKVADAKEDHRESELYRSETMRLYETILREYPELRAPRRGALRPRLQPVRDRQEGPGGQALRGADQELPRLEVRARHLRAAGQPLLRRRQQPGEGARDTTRRRSRRRRPRSRTTRSTSWPGATSTPASTSRRSRSCRTWSTPRERQGKERHRPEERGAQRLGAHLRAAQPRRRRHRLLQGARGQEEATRLTVSARLRARKTPATTTTRSRCSARC